MRGAALGVIAAIALAAAAHPLEQIALVERDSWPDEEEHVLLPAPSAAPYLAMGERELMADLIWIRGLVYYGSARHGESELRYLTKFIDNVLALDPKFRRVYEWAAHSVTYKKQRATQEEFRTSAHYLERGIEAFPNDWQLLWTLAGRYWIDLEAEGEQREQNLERATELMERAMRAPGSPPRLPLYAATLATKTGKRDRAVRNLRELILTTDHPKARQMLLQRFAGLTDDSELAEELNRAAYNFRSAWQSELPYAPPALYVVLGDAPDPAFDLDELAAGRALFGTEEFFEQFGGYAPRGASDSTDAADTVAPPEPAELADGAGDDPGPVHGGDADAPR